MKRETFLRRLDGLSGIGKAGLVISGYIAAFILAVLIVLVHVNQTSGPDRDASSGMHAFGDGLLFVFSFGVVSALPTSLALYFLRRYPPFWLFLTLSAVTISTTGLAAAVTIAYPKIGAVSGIWADLSILRIFVAPLFAGLFMLCGLFVPHGNKRRWFIAAVSMESAVSGYGFVRWLLPLFFPGMA